MIETDIEHCPKGIKEEKYNTICNCNMHVQE